MTDRLRPFRQLARDLKVDAVALVPGPNFRRTFDKDFGSHERPLVVVISAEGAPAAIVPNLELRSFDLIGFEGEVFDWRDQDGYSDAFAALARALPLESLAVEGQVMRVFVHHALAEALPGLRIVDAEREISGLRLHKTPAEVAALEEAIRISEAALAETVEAVRVGMTEKQVERRLLTALYGHGAEDTAFSPIVAAGKNSARPHAHAGDYEIAAGDALLIDFGARWGGLCADITRTFFVGHADDEAQRVYRTVLDANRRGHEITRPGVTAHEIDDAVISVLEASPYAERIRTKTGHGLGRDVHEAPYIMRGNHTALEPGMVFTNEPGLYDITAFGVRIEDDILVTDDGCRSLTTYPKELTVIGC
ncbi:Xaa-Pro dipeptidase (proline dipeptidase) [Oceanicola granulosus HTCC2516]|uniref:Xaa-Pro dipeptidase (Proline dipeptidase) n=1 Tax=Oceanicola granulosus (strain ATCC BAA-861 / DSM 15982 / KCTC 12143 / HTCC2516) TaxID=314256 RepID=Q2CJP1_OCEGH|nr:Xaa-Pro peptidase family protein [Oceanicola granulosus]EAR53098.1 Xaa-Pro dipeptidase (proline dipeptidase) [Oceanicola granulosus HTCC2516]